MKQSAGLLVYRQKYGQVEVLLAHPGGPFWAKKDNGAWSIPKGEFESDEVPQQAAKREFEEEIGQLPPDGELVNLGTNKVKSGKIIHIWAVSGDLNVSQIQSNKFSMEWPPKSGEQQEFPEIDRAEWFNPTKALNKINSSQTVFIERLAEHLGQKLEMPEQPSLF